MYSLFQWSETFAPVHLNPFRWHNHTCKLIKVSPTQAQPDSFFKQLNAINDGSIIAKLTKKYDNAVELLDLVPVFRIHFGAVFQAQKRPESYSNVGLGSSLRGEPGLTTFSSQGCPWKIISGLRQIDTHRGVPGSAAYDKKNPSNCSKSVKNLTLLLALSQKISANLFRPWLLGRPRLLCC